MLITKTPKIGFLCMIMVLILTTYAQAKITNQTCSNCHTMHGSQNGSWMRLNNDLITGFGEGPCLDCHSETRSVLLRLDCIGCHADNPSGGSNIINTNWPQIAHNAGTDLAGGNYRYVFAGDEYGHNVHGFGNANINNPDGDIVPAYTPPGYDSSYDPSSGGFQPGAGSENIQCAGQNGCHGNRETSVPYLAMKGTHHADDSMLKFGSINESQQGGGSGVATDYTTAGRSYRFLYNVKGGEDTDWQASTSTTDHNEYKGQAYAARTLAGGQSWNNVDTISEFCAECHGYFHASDEITASGGSPWLRHPTDSVVPNSGEYSAYNTYSLEAPVARAVIPNSPNSTVTPGDDTTEDGAIVMCLSCHRAHASPYADSLRWDYSTIIAGGGASTSGCFTCHTQKDTAP